MKRQFLSTKGYKNLHGDNNAERSANDRYRILLSDGRYSYAYGMLATQLNHLINDGKMEPFTIIRVVKFVVNRIASKTVSGKDQKKIIILLDVEPLVSGKEASVSPFAKLNAHLMKIKLN